MPREFEDFALHEGEEALRIAVPDIFLVSAIPPISVSHPGDYLVRLLVRDLAGVEQTVVTTVTVLPAP